MGFVVFLNLLGSDQRVQPVCDVALLITVFHERKPICLKFLRDIYLGLGEFPFCDLGIEPVHSPGVDVSCSKTGTVFRRDKVRNYFFKLGFVELRVADPGDHFVIVQHGRNQGAGPGEENRKA